MMETDIAVGIRSRVTCDRDELVAKLGDRFARRLLSRHRAGAVAESFCARSTEGPRARRHGHGALAAHDAAGEGRRRQRGRRPREAPRRPRATAARRRGDDRVPARGRRRADLERKLLVEAERLLGRGLPSAPVVGAGAARDRDRLAARDRRPRCALGLEGRVTPGADGDPGALRGHAAVHGRHRLLPALVQGDRARAGRPRPRGDHPGARAHGAAADRRRHRNHRDGRQRQHRRLRHRRHLADDAPHRRPVPGRRAGCCPSRSRPRSTCPATNSATSSAVPA